MRNSDEQLRRKVMAQLGWDDRVDASHIHVHVSDGVATLTGTAPDLHSRSLAVADAWSVAGIRAVHNALHIDRQRVSPTEEAEIRAAVTSALSNTSMLEDCDLRVSVSGNQVTLAGTVGKYWKRSAAEQIAASIRGVHDIDNKIAIVPTENFSDQQVAQDVVDAMDRIALFHTADIDVKVESGVVTMRGCVPSWAAKQAALDAARYTVGVRDVYSEIQTAPC